MNETFTSADFEVFAFLTVSIGMEAKTLDNSYYRPFSISELLGH